MKRFILLILLASAITLGFASCTGSKNPAAAPKASAQTDMPAKQATPTIVLSSPTAESLSITLPVEATATQTPTPVSALNPTEVPTPTPTVSLPTPTPAPASGSVLSQPTDLLSQTCIDKASFSADVTIPDGTLLNMGDQFTKTWKIRNEGDCTWNGYSLIYAGGEAMNSPMSIPLQEIKPGDFADISVQLQAPQRGGAHTGYWEFKNTAGQTFGVGSGAQGLLWTQIVVDYPTVVPTSQTDSSQKSSSQTTSSQTTSSQTTSSQTTSSQTTTSSSGNCAYTQNSDTVSQILSLINDARAQNNLTPLTIDSKLSAAALAHSIDMACNDFVNHTGSDGSSWYDRVKAQGFSNYASTRENIYVGNPAFGGDARGAFTWWMNSKIHHDNILYATATAIGIAYAYNPSSSYGGYYTLNIARP